MSFKEIYRCQLRSTIWACLLYFSSAQYHAQYRSNGANSPPGGLGSYRAVAPASAASPTGASYSEPRQVAYVEPSRPSTPRPLILTHRQTQTHDGGFKYAFAADNGLQQGETNAPDGTRSGAYSYVDPHGQQITIKYTAGKEGFRILEDPHKTPDNPQAQEQQQQPQPTYLQQQQSLGAYSEAPQTFSSGQQDDGRYIQTFHRARLVFSVTTAQPHLAPIPRYLTFKNVQPAEETSPSNNVIQQEPEYNDEPGNPYSFGNGYSFEFSG